MNPGALMLVALIGAHCFFDYAGQGDFMSKAKNARAPMPGVSWRAVLLAHAAIHGAAVALITGLPGLFVAETCAHAVIDHWKCRGRISFVTDQWLHIGCKVAWFVCAVNS